jgi:hypothetical protein
LQGWPTIFVRGPHWAFICASRAKFMPNMFFKAKIGVFAGRMWPAGRMLPPPDLLSAQNFKFFSRHFSRLDEDNQRYLMERSNPRFIQLNLAIWLIRESNNFIKFKDITSQLGLFRPDTDLNEYETLVNQLNVLSGLRDRDQLAVFFYLILFDGHDAIPQSLVEIELMNELIFVFFVKTSRCQFHQQFTYSFYARRSRKRKKYI